MLWDIVNILIGLIGGFASGFYFERRGSRAAREQHEATLRSNEELRAYIMELEQSQSELQGRMAQMQESVYSAARSGEPQPRRGVAGSTRRRCSPSCTLEWMRTGVSPSPR